jgi:hypothetical protein
MRHYGAATALLAFALLMPGANGQSIIDTTTASKWYVGIKGGFVLATVWGPGSPWKAAGGTLVDGVAGTLTPNVSAGANFPIIINDHFTLEPEVLITTKGTRWRDTTELIVEQEITRRQLSIDVPVLAKLMILKPEKRFRPAIYAGPQVSLNVYTWKSIDGQQTASWSNRTYSQNDSTLIVDVSAVGGLALHIRAGRGFFIVDARVGMGFLNMGSGDTEYYPAYIRNAYGTGSVAYCFNPKRRKSLW